MDDGAELTCLGPIRPRRSSHLWAESYRRIHGHWRRRLVCRHRYAARDDRPGEHTRTFRARSQGQTTGTTHTRIMPTHPNCTNYSLP